MRFEFSTSQKVIFGPGTLDELGSIASNLGKRALLIIGVPEDYAFPLLSKFTNTNLSLTTFLITCEPTIDLVQSAVNLARQENCDLLVGYGGGSAMDTAKAVSAMLTNTGNVLDYLEVVGSGQSLSNIAVPCITIPTTAGTGAEVTRNAVLGVPESKVKVSLRSHLMLPRLALVDPELTYNLPPDITASTGLDALTQVIEPYVSQKSNPLTDALCIEGISRSSRSLRKVYQDGNDKNARLDMCLASLFGGMALANSALGAVHGFASVLGGMFNGPHGAICARLLPLVMDVNTRALTQRQANHPALSRYDEIAKILTGKQNAVSSDGVKWVIETCSLLNIPPLSSYGIRADYLPEIVEKSSKASSMKRNPVTLSRDELLEILERAI